MASISSNERVRFNIISLSPIAGFSGPIGFPSTITSAVMVGGVPSSIVIFQLVTLLFPAPSINSISNE